jgi:hypothetical protein
MAILDLYTKSTKNYKNAGGKTPATTDFIKGINPQQVALNTKVDATDGFVANRTPADKNITDFNMIDKERDITINDFNPLDMNNDYFVGKTKVTGYNPTKLFNDGALTNPKG